MKFEVLAQVDSYRGAIKMLNIYKEDVLDPCSDNELSIIKESGEEFTGYDLLSDRYVTYGVAPIDKWQKPIKYMVYRKIYS